MLILHNGRLLQLMGYYSPVLGMVTASMVLPWFLVMMLLMDRPALKLETLVRIGMVRWIGRELHGDTMCFPLVCLTLMRMPSSLALLVAMLISGWMDVTCMLD